MPVYLCESGAGEAEPWRHGIQVFAAPFPINVDRNNNDTNNNYSSTQAHTASGRDGPSGEDASGMPSQWSAGPGRAADAVERARSTHEEDGIHNVGGERAIATSTDGDAVVVSMVNNNTNNANTTNSNGNINSNTMIAPASRPSVAGVPIRRVRHAEVVLVDDVCIAYGRYWLRLRWPGQKGGFAGYIAMGLVTETKNPWGDIDRRMMGQMTTATTDSPAVEISFSSPTGTALTPRGGKDALLALSSTSAPEERIGADETDHDDPTRDDEPQDTGSTKSSEPVESTAPLTCLRTGIPYPTSVAMKLMAVYDDGICPPVSSSPVPCEPVFCRICREGLHDDADQQQPSGAVEEGDNDTDQPTQFSRTNSEMDQTEPERTSEPSNAPLELYTKGPVQPHPNYQPNSHAAENPLLAPCECSGSMAFVHYLCVEQWRCRSRHPEAHHGLQCETCGKPYSLPPPSARHANVPPVEVEDWLDAMPPHVMAALRLPHVGWQIGAAIVRRRWLRPIAPVIMSPLVALYCRARRLLKKRGVARRRWACSLCRRRARWKCVRCLRSYYCSRQCQNVSWHIVHKHVCYKPARFWWSVVVYGVGAILAFPGIIRDPLMYDLGLCTIPASFVIMAILGGGLATLLKKSMGVDLRGRSYEFVVLLLTLWLVVVSWGVVGGFFGNTNKCFGAVGSIDVTSEDLSSKMVLNFLQKVVLKPAQTYYLFWDKLALKSGPWLRKALCTAPAAINTNSTETQALSDGCFEHLPYANADFFLNEFEGQRCASDLLLILWLYVAAGFVLVGQNLWKRRERQRRARRQQLRDEPRPHQD